MSGKVNIPPTVWLDKSEAFFEVGRSLRQAFKPALTAAPDCEADALLRLLMDTSIHEMASC